MKVVPLRLQPGEDLRRALEAWTNGQGVQAGWVLSGIGSLSLDGAHLHISVADSQGAVCGGHLAVGAKVRTTAEVLVALLPAWSFFRETDPATGSRELRIRLHV